MTIRAIILTLLLFIGSAKLWGAEKNTFYFSCDLMEKHKASTWQVVDSRSYFAKLGESFQFSLGNVSYRLQADKADNRKIMLRSDVNCMAFPQRNFFRDDEMARGASIFFDSVLVRGNSLYRLRLTFDSLGSHTYDCDFRLADSSFIFDPSGRFDFYYIKNSLGDYRWNQIRDAFELDLKKAQKICDFKDPVKINFYISPCRVSDIGWDTRWDNAFDFARNNLLVHYTHGVNTLNPQSVYILKFIRTWGYAPALLLEGIGSIMEFGDMFAKESLKSKKLPSLAKMSISKDFRKIDRKVSAYAAGSFVNYLVHTHSMFEFHDFYQEATDLSLAEAFEKVYKAPLENVEREWHNYLDTLTLSASAYDYYQDRAQSLMNTDDMTGYAERLLQATADTSLAGPALANLYYTFGDYAKAEKLFRVLARKDTVKNTSKVFLANMLLTEGKTAEAESLYQKVATTDTSEYYPTQKLGQIEFQRGNYPKALDYIRKTMLRNKVPANAVDLELALGDVYAAMGEGDSSRHYYQKALDEAKILIGSFNDNPLHQLRAGKAALRLGSPKQALEYLDLAFFLEERMFYIGQILLARGQANDLLGEREAAKENYRELLKLPTAFLEKQQAERYLKTPFAN